MMVILVCQIGGAIAGFVYSNEMKTLVEEQLDKSLKEYEKEDIKKSWNDIQSEVRLSILWHIKKRPIKKSKNTNHKTTTQKLQTIKHYFLSVHTQLQSEVRLVNFSVWSVGWGVSPCLIERARFTTWIHWSVWIVWIVNKNPLSLGNMVEKAVGLSFEASVNQRPEDDEIYRYIDFFC